LRAVFIYNHNPVVVHPDQNRIKNGLSREEIFLVGIEIAMTESIQYCDIVLPAASHFECDDLYASYGHHWLQRAEAVIRRSARSSACRGPDRRSCAVCETPRSQRLQTLWVD